MKNSMLDGKRLIELPEKIVMLVKLEFSEEEREIYKMVSPMLLFHALDVLKLWIRSKLEHKLILTAISGQGLY